MHEDTGHTVSPPLLRGPAVRGGHAVWSARQGTTSVLFVGQGPASERLDIAARVLAQPIRLAWTRQVHGAGVVETALSGDCGEGDALVTVEAGLVLSIATAD